jgi:hypothetical protein
MQGQVSAALEYGLFVQPAIGLHDPHRTVDGLVDDRLIISEEGRCGIRERIALQGRQSKSGYTVQMAP